VGTDVSYVKTIIIRALSAIGLVPARQYEAEVQRANELRTKVGVWKKRTDRALARGAELERRAAEMQKRFEKQGRVLKDREQLSDGQTTDFEKMQKRLAAAEHALVAARQHLMTMEVKLEILEGAANVLDARTRAVIQPRKTGAPV